MTRLFLERFFADLEGLRRQARRGRGRGTGTDAEGRPARRVGLVTGRLMEPIFRRELLPALARAGWEPRLIPVTNRLLGPSVTCAGLLGGQDMLEAVRQVQRELDLVLLPQDCLNIDRLFLDDISLEGFRAGLAVPVVISSHVTEALVEWTRGAFPADRYAWALPEALR